MTEVNKYGTNAKIKGHILSDEEMDKAGFRLIEDGKPEPYWYFCRGLNLGRWSDISFGVEIYCNSNEVRIDVLDEDFCQPYDYQMYLESNPRFEFALKVKEQVEEHMERLQELGILSGHVYGEYI